MSGNLFYPRQKLYPRRKQKNQKQNSIFLTKTKIAKTAKQMERHLKGVANHHRIAILFLVAQEEGISVGGISRNLSCNLKTIAEHTRRLVLAGLVDKKYEGHTVRHKLTPYGKVFISFLTEFSNS